MRTETIVVNGCKFLIKINYEARKGSTASISRKAVNIRIPLNMNREDQFRQLLKMKSWAMKKLLEDFEKYKPLPQKQYNDGDNIKVGDADYKLSISIKNKNSSSARIIGNRIEMFISSNLSEERKRKHISTLLSRCIARTRLSKLQQKIKELNNIHFNQKINKIFFKHNKSNWGSCSEDGNDLDYYQQFYMELYGKLGMNEKYIEIAKESGFSFSLIDKLISLNRLDEALAECDKCRDEDSMESIEDKKIEISRKSIRLWR